MEGILIFVVALALYSVVPFYAGKIYERIGWNKLLDDDYLLAGSDVYNSRKAVEELELKIDDRH